MLIASQANLGEPMIQRLPGGVMLPIRNALHARIECTAGRIWITQENDPDDVVLTRGRHFIVTRPGLTLIETIGPSSVVVWSAQAPAVRWLATLRAT